MEIGLFPLQLVLLPTERVPLHIFEPRYRELIGECLARESEFGLVLADERGLREIGTRARVAEVLERFPDGRLNILVQGGERFRVVELTRGRSFQTANVEAIGDEREWPSDDAVERGLRLFRRLREATESEVDEPDPALGHLSYQLASRVDFGAEVKQQLLELRSEPRRLDIVCELLEGAIKTVELESQVRERASGNGKVTLD
jgi:Lon protease-like protein